MPRLISPHLLLVRQALWQEEQDSLSEAFDHCRPRLPILPPISNLLDRGSPVPFRERSLRFLAGASDVFVVKDRIRKHQVDDTIEHQGSLPRGLPTGGIVRRGPSHLSDRYMVLRKQTGRIFLRHFVEVVEARQGDSFAKSAQLLSHLGNL